MQRYIVSHLDDAGVMVLSEWAEASEVPAIVLDDLLRSPAKADIAEAEREILFNAVVALTGLPFPPFPLSTTLFDRVYRIEELPDDHTGAIEFLKSRFASPELLGLVVRIPGKFRCDIWPNESQHRGRPHCRVSHGERSATFSIPDGVLLAGSLGRHQAEASRTIRLHGSELLQKWDLMRPDDQRIR